MSKFFHLAQINIGRFMLPAEHLDNKDFFDNLDQVNQIAENSDGFIWRLKGDGNDATDIQIYNDPQFVVNMSVWRDFEALFNFAYKDPLHISFMRRRKEWFEKIDNYMAFWWIEAGYLPSIADGLAAIESIKTIGPSPKAFSLKERFGPPQ